MEQNVGVLRDWKHVQRPMTLTAVTRA